jgi:transketolase
MIYEAAQACDILAKEGIKTRLINMSSLSPVDHKLIEETARSIGKIVTAEEHSLTGGLGSAVVESLSETFPCKIKRVGVHKHCISGKPEELMAFHELTAQDIVTAVKSIL